MICLLILVRNLSCNELAKSDDVSFAIIITSMVPIFILTVSFVQSNLMLPQLPPILCAQLHIAVGALHFQHLVSFLFCAHGHPICIRSLG